MNDHKLLQESNRTASATMQGANHILHPIYQTLPRIRIGG